MTNLSPKDYMFTGVQFLLFGVYVLDFQIFEVPQLVPNFILGMLLAIGVSLCFAALTQLNTNISPFPRPKDNLKLLKSGIFKYIRHPIYSGLIVGLTSYGLYVHSSSKILICIILLIWFYFKSNYEESLLMQKFSDYKNYKKTTGRFLPKFRL